MIADRCGSDVSALLDRQETERVERKGCREVGGEYAYGLGSTALDGTGQIGCRWLNQLPTISDPVGGICSSVHIRALIQATIRSRRPDNSGKGCSEVLVDTTAGHSKDVQIDKRSMELALILAPTRLCTEAIHAWSEVNA